jgi:UPF0716 protein FxsA
MRRRIPWWVLAGLFVVLPLAELFLLIQLGQVIGPWWTILVLLADAVLGSWLVKREGSRAWRALNEALRSGRAPSRELADAALILVGGTLLVTPGFLSDVLGLFCILPLTRPVARRLLGRVVARRLTVATYAGQDDRRSPYADPRTARRPGHEGVVRGDVVE